MSNPQHNKYVEQLADTLITKGRRYGLSPNYRNDIIKIIDSVPYSNMDAKKDGAAPEVKSASAAASNLATESKPTDSAPEQGMEKQDSVPNLPSDEQVLAAVNATADIPAENPLKSFEAGVQPPALSVEKTAEQHYTDTREAPVGVPLTKFQ